MAAMIGFTIGDNTSAIFKGSALSGSFRVMFFRKLFVQNVFLLVKIWKQLDLVASERGSTNSKSHLTARSKQKAASISGVTLSPYLNRIYIGFIFGPILYSEVTFGLYLNRIYMGLTYIQKTGLAGRKNPQKIQIFRRKIVSERENPLPSPQLSINDC